ncbi:MAG: hypothetical protein KDD37_03070, partial [Bdellovibrionales bacterium]|nr:hypothetical protein [Bdellovibrionales bacterium]
NIQSIYPTYTGAQQLGASSTLTPTTIDFRGSGFGNSSSSVPGNPSSITVGGAVVGQLDLSNLGTPSTRAQQTVSAPVGSRLQIR